MAGSLYVGNRRREHGVIHQSVPDQFSSAALNASVHLRLPWGSFCRALDAVSFLEPHRRAKNGFDRKAFRVLIKLPGFLYETVHSSPAVFSAFQSSECRRSARM